MIRPRHRSTARDAAAYPRHRSAAGALASERVGTEPEPIEPAIYLRSPPVERLAHRVDVALVQREELDQAPAELVIGCPAQRARCPGMRRRAPVGFAVTG